MESHRLMLRKLHMAMRKGAGMSPIHHCYSSKISSIHLGYTTACVPISHM